MGNSLSNILLLIFALFPGGQLGIALQLIAAGYLATYWGWQSIFYANGTLGAIWMALYMFFGSASPEHSKIISQEELSYIQKSLGRVGAHEVSWSSNSDHPRNNCMTIMMDVCRFEPTYLEVLGRPKSNSILA